MRYFKPLFALTIVAALAGCASDEGARDTNPSPAPTVPAQRLALSADETTKGALVTLASLAAQGRPMDLGFASAGEVSTASLADPLAMYMVSLDGLSKYSPGQDPASLLIDEGNRMYPVTVLGSARAAVIVTQRSSGTWEASSFGYASIAPTVYVAREALVAARGVASTEVSLVRIPTMGAWLLADTENGTMMLTPLYDLTRAGLVAGKTVAAAAAFQSLRPLAEQINPNTPN